MVEMWENSRCAIAAWLECFQGKPRTVSEWKGLPGEESVKRFERSNGLDTALYKTIPLPLESMCFLSFRCNVLCCSFVVQHVKMGLSIANYKNYYTTDHSSPCTIRHAICFNFMELGQELEFKDLTLDKRNWNWLESKMLTPYIYPYS